jgi:tetratricopeptide (TPR) repeat protein
LESSQLVAAAQAAYASGRLDVTESTCQQILAVDPRNGPAQVLLGFVHAQTNRIASATQLLKGAVMADPSLCGPRAALGALLMQQGQWPDAAKYLEEAVALSSNDAGSQSQLGVCYLQLGRPIDAAASFDKALTFDPSLSWCRDQMATILERLGLHNLADRYRPISAKAGVPGRAVSFDSVRAAPLPLTAAGYFWLGWACSEEGGQDLSESFYRRSLDLDPTSVPALANLAGVLQKLGRFEEADGLLRRALQLAPDAVRLYVPYVVNRRVTEEDVPFLDRAIALANHGTRTDSERYSLNMAIGKGFDDLAEYERAMRHFDLAHSAAKAGGLGSTQEDLSKLARANETAREIFSKRFFESVADAGSSSEVPVFIVGMMRSGTTLLERILARHGMIGAAGELTYWSDIWTSFLKVEPSRLEGSELQHRQFAYLDLLRSLHPDKERVIDKHPENYVALGLIYACLPNARIIHCQRHPVDTCLSLYMTPNLGNVDWCHDRGQIVFVYRQYRRIMEEWRSVLPTARFLEVEYEKLVTDHEATVRRTVEFLGLPWDEACLTDGQDRGSVETPSLWQARQPIYQSSLERWRNYEPWLGEFRELNG